jgi:hypothetical protein
MPRPPQRPPRRDVAPDELEAYDAVVGRAERMGEGYADAQTYWSALLNSPAFAAALARLGTAARAERPGGYTHAERELVDMVLSFDWDYRGVLGIHVPDAVALGTRLEAIEALREGREEDLTEDEALLVDYVRRVASGTVTDEAYEALERRSGKRWAAEFTIFVGFLMMTIRLWQALGVPDIPDAEIGRVLDELRSGELKVDDVHLRLG